MNPSARTLAKLLLAAVATVLAFAVGEIAVRLVGVTPTVIPVGISKPDDVCVRSANPILSYELKPNYRNPDADGWKSFAYTNAHGLRDVEREVAKPPGRKRILIVGDSVVAGHGVKDLEDLMSRQLEHMFPSGKVEVFNLGVSGYCTRAEIELLRQRGLQFDPDLVILVFVENDFVNFQREARYIEGRYDRSALVKGLFEHSHLFRLAALKFNLFGYGLETNPAFWNQQALGDNNVDEGLRLLRELARREGFEVVIAAWPYFDRDEIRYDGPMVMPGTDELVIGRLGRMHGLRVVELAEPFRQDWLAQTPRPNANRHYTIGDHLHPSAEGHRVAARALYRIIEEDQLLESIAPPRTLAPPGPPDRLALETASRSGAEKPDYSALHLNVARELVAEGKLQAALDEFEKVLQRNPARYGGLAHYEMGEALRTLDGDLEQAAQHLAEAVRLEPDQAAHFASYGLVLNRLGKRDEAIKALAAAVRLEPDATDVQFNLGTLLKAVGRTDEAVEHYAAAVRLNPADADYRNNYGNALRLVQRHDEAIAELQEALKLAPESPQPRYNLALVYAETERKNQAQEHAAAALKLAQAQAATDLAMEIESLISSLNSP